MVSKKSQLTTLLIVMFISGCASMSTPDILAPTDTRFVFPPTWTTTSTPTKTTTVEPALTTTFEPESISPRTPVNSAIATLMPTQGLAKIPVSTFNPDFAVTQTPSSGAICQTDSANPSGLQELIEFLFPKEQDDKRNSQIQREEMTERFISALNSGGIVPLYTALIENSPPPYYDIRYIDLTNDGVPELIVADQNYYLGRGGNIYVFGCVDGEYQVLLAETPIYDEYPEIVSIQDLNMNGVMDLVIGQISCHYCYAMRVYEWGGEQFNSLVRKWLLLDENEIDYWDIMEMNGYARGFVEDIDNNGTYELIIDEEQPSYLHALVGGDGPWRGERIVFEWDGNYFVWHSSEYTTPAVFRFQAVQDGDIASEHGELDKALSFYQDAIFSDTLSSWTADAWYELVYDPEHTSISLPDINKMPFNEIEYEQLATYSRYRIMLLYVLRGWNSDAKTVFSTLQRKVTPDSPGYPYLEMATIMWSEYTLSGDIGKACEKVIAYVEEHNDILTPLGNIEHGFWSRYYEPIDICPFTNDDEIE